MKIKQPFTAVFNEPCNATNLYPQGYFNSAPPAVLMQPHNDPSFRNPVSNSRMRADIRGLLQSFRTNPTELLVRSALKFLESPAAGSPQDLEAKALADLTITGRTLYERFMASPPQATVLANTVRERTSTNPVITVAQINTAVRNALDRAYTTAWVLQGFRPTTTYASRQTYGWIAVSAEDDAPHRPVNVPGPAIASTKLQQYNLDVNVQSTAHSTGLAVKTRYCILGNGQTISPSFNIDSNVTNRLLPTEPLPIIAPNSKLILFIHGHSSRLEEALDLAEHLIPRGFTVISMDLPGAGYASTFGHTVIGSMPANSSTEALATEGPFPALEFIEQFIIDFVNTLGIRVGRSFTHQVHAVMGGSLGGNMSLRLAQRSHIDFPWLNTVIAWSPASTWGASWARARLTPFEGGGTYMDVGKHEAVRVTRDRANEGESDESRYNYFYQVFGHYQLIEGDQSDRWYRNGWEPCKAQHRLGARFDREEIYSDQFRRWHWRVAHEQLMFMHFEATQPGAHPRFKNIQSRLLLGAGEADNTPPDKLWDNTRELSLNMINTEGTTMWFRNTGHSIQNERPQALAEEIARFMAPPNPSGNIIESWTEWRGLGGPQLLAESLTVGVNENGLLELLGTNSANRKVWAARQTTHNANAFGAWSEITANIGDAVFDGKLAVSYFMDGRLRMYARRTNGWIVHFTQNTANGAWSGTDMGNVFRQLIGGAQAGPAVEVRVGGSWHLPDDQDPIRLHLVAAPLTDGHIHIRGQTSSEYPNGWWTGGRNVGNRRFNRTPVIARNHDGRLEMFNVDTAGNACHIWENSSDNWQAEWQPLNGGVLTGGIAVARNRDGRLEVFGRGTDGRLWHCWQNAPNSGWSAWESLGGDLAEGSTPAVALNAWGGLEVFVRARDNSIQYRRLRTEGGYSWTDWVSLGGIVTSNPVVGANTNGSLFVFALGTDNRLFVRMQQTTRLQLIGYRHIVTSSNISQSNPHLTELDHPLLNGNPNARLFILPNYNVNGSEAAGVNYWQNAGVWYNGTKWTIFNQNTQVLMPESLVFNVLIVPIEYPNYFTFRVTPNSLTNFPNSAVIDNPLTNNNPNALLLVTQNWAGTYNNNSQLVSYSQNKWSIGNNNYFSQNPDIARNSAMPVGAQFNVLVLNEGAIQANGIAYMHVANSNNIVQETHITFLNHPSINGNRNTMLFATANWGWGDGFRTNSGQTAGPYNDSPLMAWYDHPNDGWHHRDNYWSLYNANATPIPVGAKINVVALF
jgi:alpha-beta hydrolase superfamily lysophospholipase